MYKLYKIVSGFVGIPADSIWKNSVFTRFSGLTGMAKRGMITNGNKL